MSGAITLDAMSDAVTKLLTANVDPSGAKWLMTPFVFGVLRKLKDTTGRYLVQPDPTEAGAFRILGFPVTVTARIPTAGTTPFATTVVLWVPSTVAVARDIAPQVKVLDQTYATSGQVGIRVQARYDAGPLYPEAIVKLTGVNGG